MQLQEKIRDKFCIEKKYSGILEFLVVKDYRQLLQ
jgi:hypothetical protein